MKSFNHIAFYTVIFLFTGCQAKPGKERLQQLVTLTAANPQKEICIASTQSEISTNTTAIAALLSEMGYDCCSLYYKPNGEVEDSVLVLTKKRSLEAQTLYYDFATRERELKTWNYPNAGDKRVKLAAKIYLQSSGFD